jgi:hypothetical protein
MPAQESSQHAQYFLNYHTVPLATSALLGRDLWQESTAFKAGVLETIYNTLPTPTVSRSLYDGWTWSDDETWSAGAGLYGGGGMQSRYYGDFMMAAAQEFPSTAIGNFAPRLLCFRSAVCVLAQQLEHECQLVVPANGTDLRRRSHSL